MIKNITYLLFIILFQYQTFSQDLENSQKKTATFILVDDDSFPCYTCANNTDSVIENIITINWFLKNETKVRDGLTDKKIEQQFQLNEDLIHQLSIEKHKEFIHFFDSYKECMQQQRFHIIYKDMDINELIFNKSVINNTYLISKTDFQFLINLFK